MKIVELAFSRKINMVNPIFDAQFTRLVLTVFSINVFLGYDRCVVCVCEYEQLTRFAKHLNETVALFSYRWASSCDQCPANNAPTERIDHRNVSDSRSICFGRFTLWNSYNGISHSWLHRIWNKIQKTIFLSIPKKCFIRKVFRDFFFTSISNETMQKNLPKGQLIGRTSF